MKITHNLVDKRFETVIDGVTAYLTYEYIDDNTLNYSHTIVPTELGGRGIGSALVKHALEYAKTHGKSVIADCSFVAGYIQKYPEYQQLVK